MRTPQPVIMKTMLIALSLLSAAAIPTAFAAGLAGVPVPSSLDPVHGVGLFVAAMALLTAWSDYRRPQRAVARAPLPKAVHPLAA